MTTKARTVKEYHANFTDPGTKNKYNISSESFNLLQKDVKHILGDNNTQIELGQDKSSYVIVLRDQPVGWVSQYEVPESMSVTNISNTIISMARAA